MTRAEISRTNTASVLEEHESKELSLAYKSIDKAVIEGKFDVSFFDPSLSNKDMECLRNQGYVVSSGYDDEDDPECDTEFYTIVWR
jgi:hypothetical protein